MTEPFILGVLYSLWVMLELPQQSGKVLISIRSWAFPFKLQSVQKLILFSTFFIPLLCF